MNPTNQVGDIEPTMDIVSEQSTAPRGALPGDVSRPNVGFVEGNHGHFEPRPRGGGGISEFMR
jgi:hypothetical protein